MREGERRLRAARLAYGHGTFRPRDEAAWLVFHALGLPTDAPAGRKVGARKALRALRLIDERVRRRRPAAYLTREAWLGGLRFYVDERVIVPRSHIADLLGQALSPWIADRRAVRSALDLCTGSGCLAVLTARAFPRARVDAADISPGALAVARVNVRRHRLAGRIRLVRSDLFSALGGEQYDLIVCNPPYVTSAAMRRLPREYRYEPRGALAGGKSGLDLVRPILRQAAAHLGPAGLLCMEVGSGRRRLERAFPRMPFTWAETPGGGGVLILSREQLTAAAARAPRAGTGLRVAAARRTGRVSAPGATATRRSARASGG